MIEFSLEKMRLNRTIEFFSLKRSLLFFWLTWLHVYGRQWCWMYSLVLLWRRANSDLHGACLHGGGGPSYSEHFPVRSHIVFEFSLLILLFFFPPLTCVRDILACDTFFRHFENHSVTDLCRRCFHRRQSPGLTGCLGS